MGTVLPILGGAVLVFFEKILDKAERIRYNNQALKKPAKKEDAGVAHLVERHLAKVEVASSSLVFRSSETVNQTVRRFCFSENPWRRDRFCAMMAP